MGDEEGLASRADEHTNNPPLRKRGPKRGTAEAKAGGETAST